MFPRELFLKGDRPMNAIRSAFLIGVLAGCVALSTGVTVHAQTTAMKKGEGGSAVHGSARPTGAHGVAADLERCLKADSGSTTTAPRSPTPC